MYLNGNPFVSEAQTVKGRQAVLCGGGDPSRTLNT